MASFTYKKATTTTLKVCGIVDIEKGTIEVDGEEKKINNSVTIRMRDSGHILGSASFEIWIKEKDK